MLRKYVAFKMTPSNPAKIGMTGADENRHFLRVFIQTYRNLPVLWDTSLRDYTNREKRAEAYEQLIPIYRYLKRDATVEDVKKKINTLRTNYRKELKVVECARRSGTLHQTRCWTFHELDFLRNTEKFLAVNPSLKGETMSFTDSSQTQSAFMDSSNYHFKTMMGDHMQSPPSITELFQKSFGPPQKLEPSTHHSPGSMASNSTATHNNASVGSGDNAYNPHHHHHNLAHHGLPLGEMSTAGAAATGSGQLKRQRLSSTSTTPSTSVQNPDELLTIACDYLSTTFPEEESIARTWTCKLKRMHRDQRLLAEKFINDILFEAETGALHRGSVHIQSFQAYERFSGQQQQQQPSASLSDHARGQQEVTSKSQSPSVHTSSTTAALSSNSNSGGGHENEGKVLNSNESGVTNERFGNFS